ncbi:MAG TPA: 3-demethylubiquinone-9 3-O-methyltransferase [Leptolyngbyaceae cyanobacterium M65_K2018_010]|nr:3-demethylubiquinone-9 3-O-methyltransferase [Leptolyngbyaceae cyanobacterium M65_K2018_010]
MIRNNLAFYDQQARRWWQEDALFAPLQRLNPLRFEYFDRVVPAWAGSKVLDVGCGGGFTCEFLAQRGAQVWGIDPSVACIEAARTHATQAGFSIHYHQGTAEALPFADHSFDRVVCVDVLEHVADPQQAVTEMARVLKPGGVFCFDTLNRTGRSRLIMIWLLEDLLRQIPRGLHNWSQFLTPSELTQMLLQSGLEDIHLAGFNLFGSTLAEHWATYWYYQTTGQFRVRFDDDTRVMYIGTAVKGR